MKPREYIAWALAITLLCMLVTAERSFIRACGMLQQALQRENAAKLELDVLRRKLLMPAPEDFLPSELKRELET